MLQYIRDLMQRRLFFFEWSACGLQALSLLRLQDLRLSNPLVHFLKALPLFTLKSTNSLLLKTNGNPAGSMLCVHKVMLISRKGEKMPEWCYPVIFHWVISITKNNMIKVSICCNSLRQKQCSVLNMSSLWASLLHLM